MKNLEIATIGLSPEEANELLGKTVGNNNPIPDLKLAIDALESNEKKYDIIFIQYNSHFNLTKSVLDILKKNPFYSSTVVILLAEKELSILVQWFFNMHLIDDVFDSKFDVKQKKSRIDSLLRLKKSCRSSREKNSFGVKIPLAKRAFDIVVASTLLLMLSPLLLIVAIIVTIESGYPFYYKSKRVGTGYKLFDFYKFRSMKKNADALLTNLKHKNQYSSSSQEDASKCSRCESLKNPCSPLVYRDGEVICEALHYRQNLNKRKGTFIKIANDPRVTRFGKFIRNTSIDELPQLINVLKGDMSIVGNRPLPLYEAELLTTDKWSERFSAPAGITGLWQVEKRGNSVMSPTERKELDNKYARNYSLINDIKLLFKTIPALFQKESV